jgi:hypothetical protein
MWIHISTGHHNMQECAKIVKKINLSLLFIILNFSEIQRILMTRRLILIWIHIRVL